MRTVLARAPFNARARLGPSPKPRDALEAEERAEKHWETTT